MAPEEQADSPDAVRAELRRILESPRFDASERNRKFLTHVVEEALAGRTQRIRAHSGRRQEAAEALDTIRAIDANYGERVVADRESRGVAPELIRPVVAVLAKAGLNVTAPPPAPRRRRSGVA